MSNQINITKDGLEFLNNSGRRVVIRPNHAAESDTYIDLPTSDGTISTGGGADGNDAVKVSSNDTTAGFLESKLVAGSNITLTTNNDGGNETLTIASSGGGGGGGSSSTIYSVTTNDAENTDAEVTLYTFTVPANTWADGDVVGFELITDCLRSAGNTSRTITITMTGLTDYTPSISLSTTESKGLFHWLWFKRVGTDLVSLKTNQNQSISGGYSVVGSSGDRFNVNASFDFTSNFVVTGKVTLPEASASTYVRVRNAYAFKVATNAYHPNIPL